MAERMPVVLVPGLLCSAALFEHQIEELAKVAPVTVADHTRQASLEAIARSILAAAPPRFALVGLSMGGYVAFEMIRQAPERVDRLALIASNARADREEQLKTRRILIGLAHTMGVRAVQAMLLRYLVHPSRLADRQLTSRVLDMADATGVEAFVRQQTAIMRRPDNRPFLKAIGCPTLVLVGAEDGLTPPKVAEEMHAGIAGSRLTIVPDCGHLATMEQPRAVSAALVDWLRA
jgi:pimeloyl-ACP methyl ester carboxylesterase